MKGILLVFLLFSLQLDAQDRAITDTSDVNEIVRNLFGKKDKPVKDTRASIAILPAIGYNPSVGLLLGGTLTGGSYLGDPATTALSTATATAFVTTKGVLNLQLRHNVFTSNNNFNIQGNIQITRMVVIDYGLGTRSGKEAREYFSVNQYSIDNNGKAYPIRYNEIRINEKIYKKVAKGLMVGAGIAVNYHFDIDDQRLQVDSAKFTPHYNYSLENGFSPKHYFMNGVFLNAQYTTRDHPNRPYKGFHSDISFRINPMWLGSSDRSLQMMTEFRKYFSLSRRNPEHVMAFWHLGTYRLGGNIPYLDLPATATDMYNRSGRAYTIGRFRGPSFFYLESEYRFPITRNKLFSGVAFCNMETASNGRNIKLFNALEPGWGAGLRILFNRKTRTNICIDYAMGRYGAKGLFFGLNEVF